MGIPQLIETEDWRNSLYNSNLKVTVTPTVHAQYFAGSTAFKREFYIHYSDVASVPVYYDYVRLSDHLVLDCGVACDLSEKGISILSGTHKVGEYLLDIQEPITLTELTGVSPTTSNSTDEIDVNSNKDLLNEIFDGEIPTPNRDFTENDVITSQLAGRVQNLEKGLGILCDTIKEMDLQMQKLVSENQKITSLVLQVVNHQVPDEYAKNVLEDIFKESV